MEDKKSNTANERRSFLRNMLSWTASFIGVGLLYPLFRFAGYAVKPKPRHIKVAAPLPRSGFHAEREFILFARDEQAWAVSRTCTHLGCRVNFLEDKQLIECPCHQSRFTEQGKRLRGPAERDLPVYEVAVQKGRDGDVIGYVVTI
ncbi:MAG: ubiquinol-cytochrome c reductase iron-sulfur subunit [Candidatus Electrothrix aestuarii]|uniref:Ubiquinol-cytochrome c reductase iron-sulfur subunit n=1 Tax=Candidatus Electrothrix aestuarii TaxID=3062594 RepID=A0AAU8LYQ0_9BACT|nr:ubiquinol-cytochrome c reductase iron-sulfur subunit [Candidatus Electrothrix aestuarii]